MVAVEVGELAVAHRGVEHALAEFERRAWLLILHQCVGTRPELLVVAFLALLDDILLGRLGDLEKVLHI